MEMLGDALQLSATDLVGHLNCRHLTDLDGAVARGELGRPHVYNDPALEVLWERGARHERAYVEHLSAAGLGITHIDGVGIDAGSLAQTLQAMQAGAPVIIQGAFRSEGWTGRVDVLRRVERPSNLGEWSYEPIDTKLARETKAGAVLQLCLYASLLETAQGVIPEFAYVVAPWTGFEAYPYRIADYTAYFRRVQASLVGSLEGEGSLEAGPDPVEYCDVCRWRKRCGDERREADHLSLVAGISKVQINELRSHDVQTLTALADLPSPFPWKPVRGARQSYERIREQARIQRDARAAGELRYELLPADPASGLSRLPEPCDGDVFLDLEGDPFVGEFGLEYLFGSAWRDPAGVEHYTADWAVTRQQERQIFERFIDFIIQRLAQHPQLHVYHFAPYEPAALKRLMGRYATREEELDRLLRANVFVDLYAVVRNGVRASVESYSIKKLEPFYGYERNVALADANRALSKLQAGLELDDIAGVGEEDRAAVEGYNRDDCISTWRLRDWLEQRRDEVIAGGAAIERPTPGDAEPSEATAEWLERIAPVMERLLKGVPDDVNERSAEQHGQWLLAHMLNFHRRELKAVWWELFRLSDLNAEELMDERVAVSGLAFEGVVGGTDVAPIHRYRFPLQELQLRRDDNLRAVGGTKLGSVAACDAVAGTIDIKKRKDSADLHPEAAFAHDVIGQKEMMESLLRLGSYVAEHGLQGQGAYQPARDLLLRARPPTGDGLLRVDGETALTAALRIGGQLGAGVLPIQGPPGSGKTYTAARMICGLVASGRTVAITANSHDVIRNLINGVLEAAAEAGVNVRCLQKPKAKQDDLPNLRFVTDNAAVFAAIGPDCPVAGGTAWLWSREDAFECVDVLVVDEAAQMSLANVLAVSQCARSLILLGDPQQLDQPMQGSHPDGTDVSALHHLLNGDQTIAPDHGLFLEETWRLHPRICDFTSELFYEGRLHPHEGLEQQELKSAGPLGGSGLRFLAVPHEGNQSSSLEEAQAVAVLVNQVLASGATWINRKSVEGPLTLKQILIIAPYNAQVFEIQALLPGALVGTVDKFQGQEAPLVFYSMTTSSHADAPRGMEFLYSLNRLNVATSRARCVCVLVASPAVLEADCKTPRQMQLVNAFCRYLELAQPI